jgi:hypothetical protein
MIKKLYIVKKVIHNCLLLLDTLAGVVVVVLICDFLASKTALLGLPLFLGSSGSDIPSNQCFIFYFITFS